MSLRDPESRKALRAIVGAVLALSLMALVWVFAQHLVGAFLAELLMMALAIIGLRMVFDGAENVVNAVKFKVSSAGIEGDVGTPEAAAAQKVADTAQGAADEIKAAQ